MDQSEVKSAEQKQIEFLENISKQQSEINSAVKSIKFWLFIIMCFNSLTLSLVILSVVLK